MRLLLVDDEPLARLRLRRLAAEIEHCEIAGEAENGQQALQLANELHPDVILLDIRMPGMDGLQVAQMLGQMSEPPAIIFCTAYGDHAIDAFEASATGYLLKPVNQEQLRRALRRTGRLNRVQMTSLSEVSEVPTITVRDYQGMEKIGLDRVRLFEADQKYVTMYIPGRSFLIDQSLKQLEAQYGDLLVRVHRNALVAREHIQGLIRESGQVKLKLADIEQTPLVSRRHLSQVKSLLNS